MIPASRPKPQSQNHCVRQKILRTKLTRCRTMITHPKARNHRSKIALKMPILSIKPNCQRSKLIRLRRRGGTGSGAASLNQPIANSISRDGWLQVCVIRFFRNRTTRQWRRPGSNRQPPPCKGGALPVELLPRNSRLGSPELLVGDACSTWAKRQPKQATAGDSGRTWIRTTDLSFIRAAL